MLADLQRRYQSYRWGEPELRLVGRLADPRRIAIDVGGYDGEYTRAMKRHARACLTFEPNPRKYALLQQTLAGPSVRLFPIALSDHPGHTRLFLPQGHDHFEGCATIDPANPAFGHGVGYDVETARLDDLGIADPVGLVKIDVEGHELAVLRGAVALLQRDHPNLIVEAEERHRPGAVATLREFLEPLGYRGYFLHQRRLLDVGAFDADVHQDVDKLGTDGYALNFLWSVAPDFPATLQPALGAQAWSDSRLRALGHALFG